ncbi:Cytochrome c oxidase, subunit II [uncultured Paludibacter sp.]|nr:Cytochrome c oxidase, subunit II [uncultured Paludibacter sp.]
MVDSQLVLWGQTVAYTCYALAILALMGWFGYKITRQSNSEYKAPKKLFYTFVSILIVAGVSLHIVTFNTIPWAPLDLNRAEITPNKVFDISMANHQFKLPSEKLVIKQGEKALFKVTSEDLTYGFGVFRQDNSMVFQMQVVPGHMNDILWKFEKPGVYTIRSTEYSGPKGDQMIVKDAVVVE